MKPGDTALLDSDMANWSTVEIVSVGAVYCKVRSHQDSEGWEVMKNRLKVLPTLNTENAVPGNR